MVRRLFLESRRPPIGERRGLPDRRLSDERRQSLEASPALQRIAKEVGLDTMELPAGVEAVRLLRNGGGRLLMLLNHGEEERSVELHESSRDLLSGLGHEGGLRLGPFGVALLEPVRSTIEAV